MTDAENNKLATSDSSLPPPPPPTGDAGKEINLTQCADDIRSLMVSANSKSIESLYHEKAIGDKLRYVKIKITKHGEYIDWVKNNFNKCRRWSAKRVKVSEHWKDIEPLLTSGQWPKDSFSIDTAYAVALTFSLKKPKKRTKSKDDDQRAATQQSAQPEAAHDGEMSGPTDICNGATEASTTEAQGAEEPNRIQDEAPPANQMSRSLDISGDARQADAAGGEMKELAKPAVPEATRQQSTPESTLVEKYEEALKAKDEQIASLQREKQDWQRKYEALAREVAISKASKASFRIGDFWTNAQPIMNVRINA